MPPYLGCRGRRPVRPPLHASGCSRRSPRLWINKQFLCFESIKVTAEVNSMIVNWSYLNDRSVVAVERFRPFVLFAHLSPPLFCSSPCLSKSPPRGDSAHFESHCSSSSTSFTRAGLLEYCHYNIAKKDHNPFRIKSFDWCPTAINGLRHQVYAHPGIRFMHILNSTQIYPHWLCF